MPISSDEFQSGRVEEAETDAASTEDPDPIETEKDLITSFLSERPEQAFTEREIVLGVDFSPVYMDRTGNPLGSLADGIIGFAGDVTATTIVVDDIDEALEEIVEEGLVATREVETADGTAVYYQLARE